MARTEFDRQIEEGMEQGVTALVRFVSGAPMGEGPGRVGGVPRWQRALMRCVVLAWAVWAALTWWWWEDHGRVIWGSAVVAAVVVPVVVVVAVRGRARRRHMRRLLVPMSLALKELMPAWDDAQRLKALTIPLDRSFVKVALPDGWHGQDGHKEMLRELVHARMGGLWAGEWNLKEYPFHVVFYPKQPTPKPEPPETLDFFSPEVQKAIAQCKPGQFVLGFDERHRPVIKEMTGETAMWALSVGSGGGKSSFLQMVITQLVGQGATVIGVDVKMASIICFEGIEGIHLYTDPGNIGDMRSAVSWVAQEVAARNYIKKQDPKKDFDRLTLILEEGNEFGDASKEWWTENKEKGESASDPMWGDIASVMRMGRHVNVTIIGVFQDLREAAVGNRGLRNMFRLILMGNYNANQWKMIVNTTPVPESVDKAGRMMIIEGNRRVWIQVPYADQDAFREHCLKLRAERGYSTGDLYGSPPAPSPERLPALLQVSRPLPFAQRAPQIESSEGIGAGQMPHDEGRDSERDAGRDSGREVVSLQKEGLAAVDGRPVEAEQPVDGGQEEFLPLAEIARRLADEGITVSADLIRQHKRRRKDFPVGTQIGGKELFTYSALAAYYGADGASENSGDPVEKEPEKEPEKNDDAPPADHSKPSGHVLAEPQDEDADADEEEDETEDEEAPVTLREAQQTFLPNLTIAELRRARAEDPDFPSESERRGAEKFYKPSDLKRWAGVSREGTRVPPFTGNIDFG